MKASFYWHFWVSVSNMLWEQSVKWCPPLSYAWYSCTLQTVTSHASVGSKIYYCYGQWLFPRIADNYDASPTDLEHVTYRAKCEPDQSETNFQIGADFQCHTTNVVSASWAHQKVLQTVLNLRWRLVSSVISLPPHNQIFFFSAKRNISLPFNIHEGLTSQQDHNTWKFLHDFCLHLNTGI